MPVRGAATSVSGPVTDRGGQVYNVKSYGAALDGVTDDTAAFQSAITAACVAGGGTVYHPGGTALVSQAGTITTDFLSAPYALRVDGSTYPGVSVRIMGASRKRSAIKLAAGQATNTILLAGAGTSVSPLIGFEVCHLELDGNCANNRWVADLGTVTLVYCDGAYVHDCYFHDAANKAMIHALRQSRGARLEGNWCEQGAMKAGQLGFNLESPGVIASGNTFISDPLMGLSAFNVEVNSDINAEQFGATIRDNLIVGGYNTQTNLTGAYTTYENNVHMLFQRPSKWSVSLGTAVNAGGRLQECHHNRITGNRWIACAGAIQFSGTHGTFSDTTPYACGSYLNTVDHNYASRSTFNDFGMVLAPFDPYPTPALSIAQQTIDSGTATGTAADNHTLTDSGKAWVSVLYANNGARTAGVLGAILEITAGTNAGQARLIATNTATVITTVSDFTAPCDATSVYRIRNYLTGTVTSAGASPYTLTDSSANWATNEWAGWTLVIKKSSTGARAYTIASNTATTLTLSTNADGNAQQWLTLPLAGDTYQLTRWTDTAFSAFVRHTSVESQRVQLTSVSGTTWTKSGAGWTVNAFKNYWVNVVLGKGRGSRRKILSNTATTLTIDRAVPINPDSNSWITIGEGTDDNYIHHNVIDEVVSPNNVFNFVNPGGQLCRVEDNIINAVSPTVVTSALGSTGNPMYRRNRIINPGNTLSSPPAVPASGTMQYNETGYDVAVYLTGGTVSAIAMDTVTTGLTLATGIVTPIRLASGSSITLTYTVAPTWIWIAE